MKYLLLILAMVSLSVQAAQVSEELDSLGANRELTLKAKTIDPGNRIRVVQNRDVDRYNRIELGINYGMATGGDPYVSSNLLGVQMDYHITPHWSLGGRYYNVSNSLNSEGKQVFSDAEARREAGDVGFRQPGVDYAKDSWLGVVNFYPIYGKMNLFDATISQFDLYVLAGAGQINLASGSAPIYSAGGGIGLWLTKHFATRFEARWQGYHDQIFDGVESHSRAIDQTLFTGTISVLL